MGWFYSVRNGRYHINCQVYGTLRLSHALDRLNNSRYLRKIRDLEERGVNAESHYAKFRLLFWSWPSRFKERQQQSYGFPLRCVKRILPEANLIKIPRLATVDFTADSQLNLITPDIKTPMSREWQSVSEFNKQAAYRPPQPFCLDNLRRLVGAERDAAEDCSEPYTRTQGNSRSKPELQIK